MSPEERLLAQFLDWLPRSLPAGSSSARCPVRSLRVGERFGAEAGSTGVSAVPVADPLFASDRHARPFVYSTRLPDRVLRSAPP